MNTNENMTKSQLKEKQNTFEFLVAPPPGFFQAPGKWACVNLHGWLNGMLRPQICISAWVPKWVPEPVSLSSSVISHSYVQPLWECCSPGYNLMQRSNNCLGPILPLMWGTASWYWCDGIRKERGRDGQEKIISKAIIQEAWSALPHCPPSKGRNSLYLKA